MPIPCSLKRLRALDTLPTLGEDRGDRIGLQVQDLQEHRLVYACFFRPM